MWIPQTLYKILPYIYMVAGVALFAIFGLQLASTVSAVLLFSAAALTALWRYQHRDESQGKGSSARAEWEERRARRTGNQPS